MIFIGSLFLLIISGSVFEGECQGYNTRFNVSYGPDPANILDIYTPLNSSIPVSKIIVLIHGGGWSGGAKESLNDKATWFKTTFPAHTVVNMEYRLGTWSSPGFSKQVDDIEAALNFLRREFPQNDLTFGLYGESAGAHLSLLYSYSRDARSNKSVKVVMDVVGPTDLTHTSYTSNLFIQYMIVFNLVGPCFYFQCPEKYHETSPVKFVTADVPATISFYGNLDPLIPTVQATLLQDALNKAGVKNKFTVYNGGHGDWAFNYWVDLAGQIIKFLGDNWN